MEESFHGNPTGDVRKPDKSNYPQTTDKRDGLWSKFIFISPVHNVISHADFSQKRYNAFNMGIFLN